MKFLTRQLWIDTAFVSVPLGLVFGVSLGATGGVILTILIGVSLVLTAIAGSALPHFVVITADRETDKKTGARLGFAIAIVGVLMVMTGLALAVLFP